MAKIRGWFEKRNSAIWNIRRLEQSQHRALREFILSGDEESRKVIETIQKGIIVLREYIAALNNGKITDKIDARVAIVKAEIDEIGKAG
jgi:hypothetical protein